MSHRAIRQVCQPYQGSSMQDQTRPLASDPYLWLEEIDSERALGWVFERNRESEAELGAKAQYGALKDRLKAILDSKERIPWVSEHGDWYYNFWRDAEH